MPLVIRQPGAQQTRVVDGLALNIDLAPTITELAGVEAGLPIEGTSLVRSSAIPTESPGSVRDRVPGVRAGRPSLRGGADRAVRLRRVRRRPRAVRPGRRPVPARQPPRRRELAEERAIARSLGRELRELAPDVDPGPPRRERRSAARGRAVGVAGVGRPGTRGAAGPRRDPRPGRGACLATRVAAGRPFVTFLGLAIGLGFAIVSGLSLLLAVLGALELGPLAVGWLATSVVVWAVAVLRGRLAEQVRGWGRHAAADPWATTGAGATVLGAIVVRWSVDPLVNLAPTVLRYWADGLELADAARIPETTLQWGGSCRRRGARSRSAPSTPPPRPSWDADRSRRSRRSCSWSRWDSSSRRSPCSPSSIRRWAPVAALLLFFTRSDLATDLNRNLAEDWGRMIAIAAVLAGTLAFRVGRRTEEPNAGEDPDRIDRFWPLAFAGGLLGVAAGTHLVAACVGLATLGSLASPPRSSSEAMRGAGRSPARGRSSASPSPWARRSSRARPAISGSRAPSTRTRTTRSATS